MKINISLDDELVERCDRYAKENYLSRSGLISMALTQYLNQYEILLAIKDLNLAMRKIADDKQIDEDTMLKLEDFNRFCNSFVK